jgi:TrmH family RNA methyltransferase
VPWDDPSVFKPLASDANPRFRRWQRIAASPRAVRALGLTLAEGLHLAQAVAESGAVPDAVILRRGADGAELRRCLDRLPGGVEGFELAPGLYDRICPVEHGAGLLLVIPVPLWPVPAGCGEDMIFLDGIQDPLNLGAIVRCAAAAGVRHVLCGPNCATAWAPRALRAGMGAHLRTRICEGVEPGHLRDCLDGDWIAAVASEAPPLWKAGLPRSAVGWAFGSEGAGLSESTLAQCRLRVRIPIERDIESLNVAAAAAVCLFERRRRRQA